MHSSDKMDQNSKKLSITSKQPNSRMCFVCGLKNAFGLKAAFYNLETGEVVARFTPREEHQGYPGRLHGGIAASVLDEVIGRAVNPQGLVAVWGVTVELTVKYRKPIPLGQTLTAIGRITHRKGRFFEGSGEILLSDGSKALEAKGRYMELPLEKIAQSEIDELEWGVVPLPEDPTELELPRTS
jgi:uncharacterized protein (TIGR00369 family)